MKLTKRTAINRIGEVYIKIFCIKLICSDADFFIWTKADTDLPVFDFRMRCQIFDSRHNFSYTGFII